MSHDDNMNPIYAIYIVKEKKNKQQIGNSILLVVLNFQVNPASIPSRLICKQVWLEIDIKSADLFYYR